MRLQAAWSFRPAGTVRDGQLDATDGWLLEDLASHTACAQFQLPLKCIGTVKRIEATH